MHYLATDASNDEGRFRGAAGWLVFVGVVGVIAEIILIFSTILLLDKDRIRVLGFIVSYL